MNLVDRWKAFPINEEKWTKVQQFANLLQGYKNVLAEQVATADQAVNIEAEAKKLDLKDAGLLPGWTVLHIPRSLRGKSGDQWATPHADIDKPPLWLIDGPMHKRRAVKHAVGPGFSGSRDQALAFLAEHWLNDYQQRLELLQMAAEESRDEAKR